MKSKLSMPVCIILFGLISGCAFNTTTVDSTNLANARSEIRERDLMDVGIEIFEINEIDADAEEQDILPGVRKS